MPLEPIRCDWAGDTALYRSYHDHEWGRAVHDDQRLFEMLLLETMQAGLSWITVLKKREALRAAFDGFDPRKIAGYGQDKIALLLSDPALIRNSRKVRATIVNADRFLTVQAQYGSFDRWLWQYVDNCPLTGHRKTVADLPPFTPLSQHISEDLKSRGFQFVGPTIVYSFMQSVGMVNDHITSCFVYRELTGAAPSGCEAQAL